AAGALTYDAGHARGAPRFVGPQHGLEQDDALLTIQPWRALTLTGSALMAISTPATPTSGGGQRFSNVTIGASYAGLMTLDYVRTTRHDLGVATGLYGQQHGARATVVIPAGPVQIATTVDGGIADEWSRHARRAFLTANASARLNVGAGSGITVFGDHSDGRT